MNSQLRGMKRTGCSRRERKAREPTHAAQSSSKEWCPSMRNIIQDRGPAELLTTTTYSTYVNVRAPNTRQGTTIAIISHNCRFPSCRLTPMPTMDSTEAEVALVHLAHRDTLKRNPSHHPFLCTAYSFAYTESTQHSKSPCLPTILCVSLPSPYPPLLANDFL